MIDYVLFDLDGTLTDPAEGITNSVAHALMKRGINVEDKSELNSFIGPPLTDSFEKYYGMTHEEAIIAVEDYREYFKPKGMFENKVYEGIPEMLAELNRSGKKLIVATSKPEVFAKRILEHFSLDGYFAFIAGSTLDGSRIKKGDVIKYALEKCDVTEIDKCIMIGDRLHDVEGAKECGMKSIGVLWGYGTRDELETAGADFIADSSEDIEKIVI